MNSTNKLMNKHKVKQIKLAVADHILYSYNYNQTQKN